MGAARRKMRKEAPMRTIRGRRVAIVSCLLAVSVVASGALFFERLREYWYLLQLRSGNGEASFRAAARLGELRSLRAVPPLIRELKGRKSEAVAIGYRKRFGRFGEEGAGAVTLQPISHALYSIGKVAMPLVTREIESHSYFDEDIQRYLDVLEAIVLVWRFPRIPVTSAQGS